MIGWNPANFIVGCWSVGWCWEREKIDWQETPKFDCRLVRTIFLFVVPRQFSQVVGEWPQNQILIPDWAYFHCPGANLVGTDNFYFFFVVPRKGGSIGGK